MKNQLPVLILLMLSHFSFAQTPMTWNGENFGSTDLSNPIMVQSNNDGPCQDQFIVSPTMNLTGLEFDGKYLWVGVTPGQLMKISPADGRLIKTLNIDVYRPYGMTFVDGHMWVMAFDSNSAYQIDTSNGRTIKIHKSKGPSNPGGIAWSGREIWHSNGNANAIFRIDTARGFGTSSRSIPMIVPIAMTFQGPDLWISTNYFHDTTFYHKVYKMDTTTFTFTDSLPPPRLFLNGLAYDGKYLWVGTGGRGWPHPQTSDTIYRYDLDCQFVSTSEPLVQQRVQVYPNPNTGVVNVDVGGVQVIQRIQVTDLQGRVILTREYQGESLMNLSIEGPSGIYFLHIETDKRKFVRRVMKE